MNPSQAPWHAGEREMQARAGVAERMEEVGARFLRDYMPEQHRQFFPLLPSLYVGALDEEGWPCASMLAGPPGFVHSPDPRLLRVEARGDGGSVRPGAPVALLAAQAPPRTANPYPHTGAFFATCRRSACDGQANRWAVKLAAMA